MHLYVNIDSYFWICKHAHHENFWISSANNELIIIYIMLDLIQLFLKY